MADSMKGLITWLVVMAYCLPLAFITHAAPLVGAILGLVIAPVVFWLMAVKGRAAA